MAKNPSPAGKRSRRTSSPSLSVAAAFRQSTLLAILGTTRTLGEALGGSVGRRLLVNFLRGNQLPPRPSDRGDSRQEELSLDSYALFEGTRPGWLDGAVDRLLEEGYLTPSPDSLSKLTLSPHGSMALERKEHLPEEVFPRGPRLGQHGQVEEKLRRLRRRLASSEERAPFSIFPNSTLAALSASRPGSLAELALIPGLGEVRIRRYGRKILAALRS